MAAGTVSIEEWLAATTSNLFLVLVMTPNCANIISKHRQSL